ncbi:MAG TPA: AAA family ATPase, partial [Ktedonobacterales bacterium]|nr:AAA family ATPase [Ktedonobacterales bacterium]
MTQPAHFGDVLKHLRTAAGLTQEALAERAGISARGISALERGINTAPRRDTLARLIAALSLAAPDRVALEVAAHSGLPQPVPDAAATAFVPLIGRTRELAAMEALLAGGAPPVLLLTGEPGIGKTRLLRAAAELARRRGFAVLEGGCRRGGQDAFAPVAEALAACIETRSPARLAVELEGCDWLARLLPELADSRVLVPPPPLDAPAHERRLMFRAVERYLGNIAGASGTLVALDDLQWAGADGLDLLLALARGAPERRLRIVAAIRAAELPERGPLADALGDLAHARLAQAVELGPLGHGEAEALLGSVLPADAARDVALVERVARRAGGVPFFLVSYAEALRTAESAVAPAALVPWDVAQSVRQRIAHLASPARDLLALLAVASGPLPLGVLYALGAALGVDRAPVLGALHSACAARLLAPAGNAAYRFTHEIIRDAVEADLSAPRRAQLHLTLAQALEQSDAEQQAEALAYHYAQAGDDSRAIAHLRRAAERASARRAHAAALQYYRDLVSKLDALGRGAESAQACDQLGTELMTLAHYDEALQVLDRALATHRAAGDADRVMRTVARIGEVHALRGTPEEGLARVRPALAAANAEVSDTTLAAAKLAHAWLLNITGHYAEALAVAEEAAHLARSSGDASLRVRADSRRSQLLLMLGQLEEGAGILEEVIALAESIGDLRSLRLALNSLGWVHEAWGDFARDAEYTERALRVAEELGDPTVIAFMTANHGSPAFNLGNWQAAREDFAAGYAMMQSLGKTWASAWPPLLLGQLDLAQGHWEAGASHLADAVALAEATRDRQALRWAHASLAEWDLLRRQPRTAYERLLPLVDQPDQREADVCQLLPLLAWAAVDLGDEAAAAAALADATARATAARMRPTLINVERVSARLAVLRGHTDQAAPPLERALASARELRCPYAEAKVLYDWGSLGARLGDTEHARQRLAASLALLGRLGERLYAEQAEGALALLAQPAAR